MSDTIHATTVAIRGRGVIIEGASGSGKSDLALRLIDRGAMLVADDRTIIVAEGGRLIARCPDTIKGRIEVRGLGIMRMEAIADVPLALAIRLAEAVERMPEPDRREVAGVSVPRIAVNPREVSAAIKVEMALKAIAS